MTPGSVDTATPPPGPVASTAHPAANSEQAESMIPKFIKIDFFI
jgi:hypothetical protein